jgi:type IX secretion system PorP/SprF family membrane protein
MKILKFCFLILFIYPLELQAQQDEQSSMYMFNPLLFNPAYAGSKQEINAVAVARSQWIGMKGAPQSQFLSLHSPIKWRNMALGVHLSNDRIGSRGRTSAYADYAYTLQLGNERKLNFGISAGGDQLTVDYHQLYALDPDDPKYQASLSQIKFNSGAGIYYHTNRFYIGFSVPRLFETTLYDGGILISGAYVKRHYFLTAGYVFPVNSVIDLKSSLLVKVVDNAPVTADLNANLFFYRKFWFGGMYRYNESIGVNTAYQLKESLMFGYSFDYPINGLSSVRNFGSHEVMLSYIFGKNRSYGSPRYF